MSDFFSNIYFAPNFFPDGYWGAGDGGNLSATLAGSGSVGAVLSAAGGASGGTGGPYGGYSSGVRWERHQPTRRRGKDKKPYRIVKRGKVKIRIDYEEDEDFGQILGPAPEFQDLDLTAFLEFICPKPMVQITAEVDGEIFSFAADDIDEDDAIAIALALVA